jgi:hypothetical protein
MTSLKVLSHGLRYTSVLITVFGAEYVSHR